MANLMMLPVLFLVMISNVTPQVTSGPLYPISGEILDRNTTDDGSSQINLKRPFPYLGGIETNLYVKVKGSLNFEQDSTSTSIYPFIPISTFLTIENSGAVYYDQHTNGSVLQQATEDINEYFPWLSFTASWVFVATWYEVPFSGTPDANATFQAVLISGDQYSFLLMNYGRMNSKPSSVVGGYAKVNSTHQFILPGSFTNSTFHLSSNVNERGRWVFRTDPGCTSNEVTPNILRCDSTDDCPRMEEYSQLCSIINNSSGPFAACHQQSDPQPFFNSCVYDLCRLTSANGTLCSAVSAYERTCSVSELSIPEWRLASQCGSVDPQTTTTVAPQTTTATVAPQTTTGFVVPQTTTTVAPQTTTATVAPQTTTGFVVPQTTTTVAPQTTTAESDPCKELYCTEFERCGEKDGVYDCLCDKDHQRPDNETYESTLTCAGSSANISVSRCQLFEDGFHSSTLHLKNESCKGELQDGRLVFHYNNDDQLCGTSLKSNGTHFIYENSIQGHVDPNEAPISRQRNIHLDIQCAYPLDQALVMAVGINPVESIVNKNLPSTNANYRLRMTPYQDSGFSSPLTSDSNIEEEISKPLFVEVLTDDLDASQISIILDSCWATPVNMANYPVRWDLISDGCPNRDDGSVEILQNDYPLAARFSFKMFTFINSSSIYLHCKVHLCLLKHNNCSTQCFHTRRRREVTYHDTTDISVGPLVLTSLGNARARRELGMEVSSASGQLTSVVILLVSLLTATTLT